MSAFDAAYTEMITTFRHHGVASGSNAEVTLTKSANKRWIIYGVQFGYRTAPTNGALVVLADTVEVFRIPVTAAGAGPIVFVTPRLLPSITNGLTYIVRLVDGSVTKDLNVEALEVQAP